MCVHFFCSILFSINLFYYYSSVLFSFQYQFFNRIIGFSYLFISINENIITYLNGIRILIKQFMFFFIHLLLLFSNWLFFCCYHRYAARINKNQHLLYSILNLFLSFGIIFLYFIYLISLVFVSVARTHNMINQIRFGRPLIFR